MMRFCDHAADSEKSRAVCLTDRRVEISSHHSPSLSTVAVMDIRAVTQYPALGSRDNPFLAAKLGPRIPRRPWIASGIDVSAPAHWNQAIDSAYLLETSMLQSDLSRPLLPPPPPDHLDARPLVRVEPHAAPNCSSRTSRRSVLPSPFAVRRSPFAFGKLGSRHLGYGHPVRP